VTAIEAVSVKKVRAQAAPIKKRKEDSTHRTIGVDGRVRWVAASPAYGVLPARLGNFQSWSMAVACAGPNSAIVEPKPYARSAQVTHRIGVAARA
jgi:hypothetical protein